MMINFPCILFLFTTAIIASLPDANPSLYIFDKLFVNEQRLKNNFKGKRIWITGASSGIGAEMTRQLCRHGAKLIISARREEELHRLKRSLVESYSGGEPNNAEVIPVDISVLPFDMTDSDEQISRVVSQALQFHKGIDVLVLNAGAGQLSPALDDSFSTTKSLMELNFMGPARLAMEVIQQDQWGQYDHDHSLIPRTTSSSSSTNHASHHPTYKRKGHLVITSSIASKMALPLGTSYAASKHAVHGFFHSLRSECADWLRIDLPCPGPISTSFQENVLNPPSSHTCYSHPNIDESKSKSESESEEMKMPVERCARLMISSMMGPAYWMQETWISRQPTLAYMFLNQYFPNLSNAILGKVGPLRLKAFYAGLPLYKLSSWKRAIEMEKQQQDQLQQEQPQPQSQSKWFHRMREKE